MVSAHEKFTVMAMLYVLAEESLVEQQLAAKAIKDLGVDPEKVCPQIV
jgi:pyruvate dehydrogenase complex dehydrogenase (E1) component